MGVSRVVVWAGFSVGLFGAYAVDELLTGNGALKAALLPSIVAALVLFAHWFGNQESA